LKFCEISSISELDNIKTQQFWETSLIFQLDNVKNQTILRDFLPQFFKVDNIKNQAILRDFLQEWKGECRPDGLVPMRFAIFPPHLGVVQNYGTRKLPLRSAFANLSGPFAPQQNQDMGL